jgi:uncharacterized protein YeaO (DUF488 family)
MSRQEPGVQLVRVYADPGRAAADYRVLVDRLWPRGVRKEALDLDEWAKDVAPSTDLRRWYDHDPARFGEFATRYRDQLVTEPAAGNVDRLRGVAQRQCLVLFTATRDLDRSAAAVLRSVIAGGP